MWRYYNPNPMGDGSEIDCTVRAICCATDKEWLEVYMGIALQGAEMFNMPSANRVWGAYLEKNGFERHFTEHRCLDCYTLQDFAAEHPKGTYLVGLDRHVVCVKDGDWYDAWDSGKEAPLYYWARSEET